MKTIILGGGSSCGWPSTLRLLREGQRATTVDDLSHGRIVVPSRSLWTRDTQPGVALPELLREHTR